MRLAFLTSLVPTAKPDTGFDLANAAIVAGLRALGHTVVVIGFARPDDRLDPDPDRELLGRTIIENGVADVRLKLTWAGHALLRGVPFTAAKIARFGTGRITDAIARRGPFDALVFNSVAIAGAVPGLSTRHAILHVSHNDEARTAAQNAATAGSIALRWLFRREARLLATIEGELARDARFIWCLSEDDRLALPEPARSRSAVLPLSVQAAPLPAVPTPSHDIGLIGTWTWEPNMVGLRWFCEQVVPRLAPTLRIAVAGRLPAGFVGPARVAMLGRVPDAGAFVAGCRVMALSARAGTGVQLKTLEAFERGVPAVATPQSVRGIAALPANVTVADEPAAFAAALDALVGQVRAGQVGQADGAAFAARQREGLQAALRAGLARMA